MKLHTDENGNVLIIDATSGAYIPVNTNYLDTQYNDLLDINIKY